VAGSAVEMALAEWRQGKDKALDEQRKKGGPTGVIGFIYRILNKFFNKFVKGVALFYFSNRRTRYSAWIKRTAAKVNLGKRRNLWKEQQE